MHQRVEYYDENTIFKVFDSLRAAGLSEQAARDCITDMQNKGILFRERGDSILRPQYRIADRVVNSSESLHLAHRMANVDPDGVEA